MRVIGRSEIFDEIKERLNRAIEYDGYILAACPFHQDNHPSFFVYPDTYSCKSCGEWGKTDELISRLTGVYIHKEKEVRIYNPFRAWEKRFGNIKETLKIAYKNGQTDKKQLEYLYRRGFTDETVRKLKLGYLDGWITVPVFNCKKLAGATARKIEGASRYFNPPKQQKDLLYIPDEKLLYKSSFVYLVFGIFDAVSLVQLGYPAITTLIGQTRNPEPFRSIRKKIIVIPDKGEEKTASNLVSNLDWRGKLLLLDYPQGMKDINDLLQHKQESILDGLAIN